MQNKRNYRIDNLRFIAILIVVLGHSIILYDPSWGIIKTNVECESFRILKRVINVIQMPIFFAMSGYLYSYTIEKYSFITILSKKAYRIILPFFCILLLYSDPIKFCLNVSGYDNIPHLFKNHLLLNQLGHLWFLPTLFACFILTYIPFKKKYDNYALPFICLFLVLHLLSDYFPTYFQLRNIAFYSVYFVIGILLNRYEQLIERAKPSITISWIIILSLLLIQFYLPPSLQIICVAGIIVLLYFSLPNSTTQLVSQVGECSFGIYLLHSPLIYITYTYITDCPPPLTFAINFIAFGMITYLATRYVQTTKGRIILGF